MYLREYSEQFLTSIEKLNPFCAITLQYHGDVQHENAICVVDSMNEVVAVGFLKGKNRKPGNDKWIFDLSIFVEDRYLENSSVKMLLVGGLIEKFKRIKERNAIPNCAIRVFCDEIDIHEIDFYKNMGFRFNEIIPVLKCDIEPNTKHYAMPESVHIREFPFTEENIHAYFASSSTATLDFESESELIFRSGNPSFKCFAAISENNVVGAISIWNIAEDRAATEDIFVVEAFKHKNIAKELIATAFDELKKREVRIATLSLRSSNSPAMNLYSSLGYTHYYDLIELLYE